MSTAVKIEKLFLIYLHSVSLDTIVQASQGWIPKSNNNVNGDDIGTFQYYNTKWTRIVQWTHWRIRYLIQLHSYHGWTNFVNSRNLGFSEFEKIKIPVDNSVQSRTQRYY